jgi:hypothetical protein
MEAVQVNETEDTAVHDFLYPPLHPVRAWIATDPVCCGQNWLPRTCRQILEEHRKNCERQGKYVEAEIAKNRLEELKLHEENRRREAMRSRQIAERLGVEEAHMLEFHQ